MTNEQISDRDWSHLMARAQDGDRAASTISFGEHRSAGGWMAPLLVMVRCTYGGRSGSMLLKKSLSTADQKFSRPLMRFSDKNVRDLVF
jgi:hypothetical protein